MMNNQSVVIFTSCNDNYTKYLPTLLMSIHENMPSYNVEFYLLHVEVTDESIKSLKDFSDKINIEFNDIRITNEDYKKYSMLKNISSLESTYPVEGFFMLLPNLHLPEHVTRALYLDAGDVILSGDISEFYFSNFKGNIVTVSKGFSDNWNLQCEDLYERNNYLQLASEYLNAGSVLFNVELMRKLNINFDYYYNIVKHMHRIHDGYNWEYFGGGKRYVVQDDQGMIGVCFVGFINIYDPDNVGNVLTIYNFRPFVIEFNKSSFENPDIFSLETIEPKIIHLLGNKPTTPVEKRRELLKISQECLSLWDTYQQKAENIMEDLK